MCVFFFFVNFMDYNTTCCHLVYYPWDLVPQLLYIYGTICSIGWKLRRYVCNSCFHLRGILSDSIRTWNVIHVSITISLSTLKHLYLAVAPACSPSGSSRLVSLTANSVQVAKFCHTVPYSTILYHTLPYCTILYHTVPYSAILCYNTLYCTIIYLLKLL